MKTNIPIFMLVFGLAAGAMGQPSAPNPPPAPARPVLPGGPSQSVLPGGPSQSVLPGSKSPGQDNLGQTIPSQTNNQLNQTLPPPNVNGGNPMNPPITNPVVVGGASYNITNDIIVGDTNLTNPNGGFAMTNRMNRGVTNWFNSRTNRYFGETNRYGEYTNRPHWWEKER